MPQNQDNKIAVFHNYMDNIGGAEKVVLTLGERLPADIYSTVSNSEMISKMGFRKKINEIGWIPKNAPFRQQLSSYRFSKLNLTKKYDNFIIAGDWAVSGAMKNKPNLWYVHSPIRELYDLNEYTRKTSVNPLLRPVFDFWASYNRKLNKKHVANVQKILCNSKNTQKRVEKYLNRKATVVYPPIDTEKFLYKQNKGYWLSVNRLIDHKRIELQLDAFRKLPEEKLIIIGAYEKSAHFQKYVKKIVENQPNNVEILNWVSEPMLREIYSECKGFITTAKEEDFGMTAVEAMASGKPVIAPSEGGYLETVTDGITGKLIDKINGEKIELAIKEISKAPESFKKECIKQAKKFDSSVFIKKIRDEISF
ncbi:MAG: mannosyl transferase [Candidatus Diapherotrites archaeon CG11_big_fil_rev_8_21_14_0_20_37_9]|nr:MAG: mannosyl transferase [Candidatus Diapherotrites archaeon CG11_big_fil_rev_8_21_14_0_20_37_9]